MNRAVEDVWNSVKKTMSRSELAEAAGVSPDTLRHYERKGVLPLPPRAANGYRRYPAAAIDRVRLVSRALAVGFTLDELARVLRERDKGGAPCRQVRALVAERFAELETRLTALQALRDELHTVLEEWDDRLSATPAGAQAHLLEALQGKPQIDAASRSRRRVSRLPRASEASRGVSRKP